MDTEVIRPLAFPAHYYLILDIFLLILQILAITGNGLVLRVYYRSKQMRNNKALLLIFVLCFVNFVFPLTTMPHVIYIISQWNSQLLDYKPLIMLITGVPIVFAFKLNLIMTIMIAICRLQSIKAPFYYRTKNHVTYTKIAIGLGCISGTIDAGATLWATNYQKHYYNCGAIGCLSNKVFNCFWGSSNMILTVIFTFLTVWVICEFKRIRKTLPSFNSTDFQSLSSFQVHRLSIGILLTSLLFLFIPSIFVGIDEITKSNTFQTMGPFYLVALLFMSFLNGILYMTLHLEIRRGLISMFMKKNRVAEIRCCDIHLQRRMTLIT